MGLGVTVQADMTDLGGGDHIHHGIHHAQTCTQNGDDCQLLTCQHPALGGGHRGLHLHLHGGQIPGGFVAHQARDFTNQLTELLDAGILVAQNCQLMLDQGMLQFVYIRHRYTPFSLFSRAARSRSA